MIELTVNGARHSVDVPEDKPLLWVLREELALTGAKYGCGIGACGACTVLIGGEVVRSCSVAAKEVAGRPIRTIENFDNRHPVQKAWVEQQVPQCGYCQPGFVLAATAVLEKNPKATEAELVAALTNLCRCGSYDAIRAAIRQLAESKHKGA
ncbi:MAG: (2Fe-2S)-binding protein [Burkholderiales bacterium]|nr:(2Fe-2S)-binding protein [Burkholderiales bacterium]